MKKFAISIVLITNISIVSFAKNSYLNRGLGFGGSIGNPIINFIMSFPFIDFEIGYGGSNGINLSSLKLESKTYDFNLFIISSIDFIFTMPLTKKMNFGLGLGSNLSISSHISKIKNIEMGFGIRLPIAIFYDITEHLEIGLKIATTMEFISNTQSLTQHNTYSGFKTNLLGGIFVKYYI